jgi:hypothetical protein
MKTLTGFKLIALTADGRRLPVSDVVVDAAKPADYAGMWGIAVAACTAAKTTCVEMVTERVYADVVPTAAVAPAEAQTITAADVGTIPASDLA